MQRNYGQTQREGLSGVEIEYPDEVIALLMREGYDQRFGARPLQCDRTARGHAAGAVKDCEWISNEKGGVPIATL